MATIIIDGEEQQVTDGSPIMDACEELGVPFSCRAGICGTCVITVKEGMENLEPKSFAFNYPKLGPDNRLFSRSFYIIRCLGPSQFETVTDLITSKTDIGVLAREMEAQ